MKLTLKPYYLLIELIFDDKPVVSVQRDYENH